MKTIDELGISPTPWSIWHKTKSRVKDSLGNSIADCGDYIDDCVSDAKIYEARYNARLIAAAPELYKLMLEAIPWLADISAEVVGNKCAMQIDYLLSRMKAALAKASGEEAE